MPAVYLQTPLDSLEIEMLRREFPLYEWTADCDEKRWPQVEVLFGNQISVDQLQSASRLRWIHSPNTEIDGLPLEETQKRNISISLSKGQNVTQIAEFVLGAILVFAKQFFHWKAALREPEEFWRDPKRESIWSLQRKTLLQVGLGEVGSSIVKQANAFGMKTWGIRRQRTFHPHCVKTFSQDSLHSLLPAADVVSIALPGVKSEKTLFQEEEFRLMKPDSILVVIGTADAVDEKSLIEIAKKGKFRGILMDAFSKNSPLWELPNAILTPSIASHPESEEKISFRQFRQNLRLFSTGRINEMKNLLKRS